MKKRILSLLVAVTMVVSVLSGCGNSSNSSNTSNAGSTTSVSGSTTSDKPVSISFYSTQTGMDDKFQDIIQHFQKENSNITVEYIAAGNDQLQKWMSLYASNEGPTVSLMDPINIWENKDRMLELDKKENTWMDQVYDNAFASYTYDGKVYAIPISTQGFGLLYNQKVCDKAVGGTFNPDTIKTRDDLKQLFDKIVATGVSATMFTGVNWSLGMHYLGLAYAGYRADQAAEEKVINESKAGTFDLAKDDVFNSLMDTFDMVAKYNYNKKDPLVGNLDIDAQAFATGKVGTWFMGDWSWVQIKGVAGRDEKFGILPIPVSNDANDVRNTKIPASQPKGYCIDKSQNTAEQQEAAKKFIQYICFDQYSQQIICDTMGATLPYKNSTAKTSSPLAAATASYTEQNRTLDISGFIRLPSDFWYENGATMQQYLAGKIDRNKAASQIATYWPKHK